MTQPQPDTRSPARKALDEKIAAEMPPPLEVPADAPAIPLESHLEKLRGRPLAVIGVVENGLVRPVDPTVVLPEHARVIIVTSAKAG